ERGDVGLVVLGDVGNRVPGVRQVFRRLPADVAHRLAFDLAPLGEIRKRRGRRAGAAAARERAADERLDVFHADAPVRAAAGYLPDLDAKLACETTDGWSRGRRSAFVTFRLTLGRRRGGGVPCAAIYIDDLAARPCRRVAGRG